MARRKLKLFEFDAESFHFGEAPRKIWQAVRTLLVYMLLTFTLAVLAYLAFSLFFRTDTERRLRREIRMYEELYSGLEEREDLLGDAIAGLQHKDNDIYSLVFHSGTPGLDPMSEQFDLAALDTLPEGVLTGRTAAKADSLLRRGADVDSAFLRIFRALSDSAAVLPPMTLPVKELSYPQVGAAAGRKINPFYKAYVFHEGVDLLVPRGTPVYATADGTVVSAASSRTTGNTVRIAHAGGYETVYCHLESMDVHAGQRVQVGKKLGTVGMSGQAFAPHLHYEVRLDGAAMDPVGYFFASVSPADYANVLYMSVNTMQSMD